MEFKKAWDTYMKNEYCKDFTDIYGSLKELEESMKHLKVGDVVKVSTLKVSTDWETSLRNEGFWNIITEIDGEEVKAEVNNNLVCGNGFNVGDIIDFKKENILSIYNTV